MVQGINYITDEKGNKTGIILDLISFKQHNITASDVINELSELQLLIDQAGSGGKKANSWDLAKEKLTNLSPRTDE